MIKDYIQDNKEAECDAYRQGYVAIRRQYCRGSALASNWLDTLTATQLTNLEDECNAFGNAYDGEALIRVKCADSYAA